MSLIICLNGKFVPKEKALVSIFDHGLLYGDGVFEGIRIYNGRVFKLDEHIDRLFNSAKVITLEVPISKEVMKQKILKTVRSNKLHDGYIRVVVTRGAGDLGLDPRKCSESFYFIIASSISLYPEKFYKNGLSIMTVATHRNIPEALSPKIKSLNYLNNIMAKIEANNYGVLEAVMLNKDGYVAECTADNIFIVHKEELITPPTYVGALEGMTRDTVMELAKEMGITVSEKVFTRFDLYVAEECFLTGTAAEIVPVINIDSRKIGNGKPGPITASLIESFHKLTRTQGTPVY
ncbi:MAG: branched-chain-amino-acid transaminase [Candidatus Firestonebacteria bacterium]